MYALVEVSSFVPNFQQDCFQLMIETKSGRVGRRGGKRRLRVLYSIAFVVALIFLFVRAMRPSPRMRAKRELEGARFLLDSLSKRIEREEGRISTLKRLKYLREGMIRPGQGMFQALNDLGVPNPVCLELVNTLSDSVELINMIAGERISLELDPEDTTRILTFSYSPHPAVVHRLVNNDDAYVYKRIDHPTMVRHRIIEGTLEQGASLDQTLRNKCVPSSMVGVVTGVLLCKISFRTHAREGDRFRAILRERYYQDSIRIEGQVLYTCYEGTKAGFHEAFRYDDGDPKSSYTAHYTEEGEALIHSGLRYPLDRLHISSGYGMRIHPLTGRRVMHRGVDYRAPTGTPVYAVAAGTVVKSGYNSNNGHYIAIRHADKYTSYYLHLHRRLAAKGRMVRARQIIGKVGSTGMSTGPHLHFGFRKPNGAWMDPLRKRMIATPKLEGDRLTRLRRQVSEIRRTLDSLTTQTPAVTMRGGTE
ncbi:MAG: peptidoglycan DD-metalloendopeptidase family protein [Chitinivibrionales bacterium]|nr:peptidoglycan DD-metalloendopeptidase family protein [Chitinivibrionales bacterium]